MGQKRCVVIDVQLLIHFDFDPDALIISYKVWLQFYVRFASPDFRDPLVPVQKQYLLLDVGVLSKF